MLKLFFRGLVFGGGLCVSALIFFFAINYYLKHYNNPTQGLEANQVQLEARWHELNQEQQIATANALLVIRYREGSDGERLAYVDEVYLRDAGVSIKYKKGDLYPRMNYYPKNKYTQRSGSVVFFSGSPSTYRHGLYLYEDRLPGYGDMPLHLLVEKFKAPAAGHPQRELPHANTVGRAEVKPDVPFHKLEIDDKIKQSSVIAIAKYETSKDGKMKAVIKEFLKKEANVTIYYEVGDELPSSSYYPVENMNRGDGVVIFFTGSPATMKMSMAYYGDRITGLGDIPMQLFRKKCDENDE